MLFRWRLPEAREEHLFAHLFGDFGTNRRESINLIYEAINECGEQLAGDEDREAVVAAAKDAFRHNIAVYKEEGQLVKDGAVGVARMVVGFGKSRMA